MTLINNLLKEGFLIFKKRKWTFIFLFLSFVVLFSLFGPIFKTHTSTKNQQNKIQIASGKYDYKIKLPDYRFFDKTSNTDSNQQKIATQFQEIQQKSHWKQKPFDFLWVSNSNFVDYSLKASKRRFYIIRSIIEDTLGSNFQQKINRIILTAGRLPKINLNEVVINSKFAKLNNIKLGQKLKLLETEFTVVGFGNNGSNIYFDFPNLLKIKRQLQISQTQFQNVNLYELSALIFMNRSLFNKMIASGQIINYENEVYINFHTKATPDDLKVLTSDIENVIKQKPEKFTSFSVDPSSGLQSSYNQVEILVFSLVFFVGILFLINFIYLIVSGIVKIKSRTISLLYSSGFKTNTIGINLFFFAFLTILFSSIIAFVFGLFLDNYLTNLYNNNSFLETAFVPFDVLWFGLFVLIIPLFVGLFFFVFAYYKIEKSPIIWSSTHYRNQLLLRRTFLFRKLQKVFKTLSISSKIFAFFFFRDFSKKVLVLLLLIILFLLSFALIFFRTSTQNYFDNQWGFYNKDIKSFTLYKRSVYFSEEGKITSNLELKTFDEFKKDAILVKDTKSLNITNPTCLLGANKLTQDSVFKSRCLSKHYIDIDSVEDDSIKNYLSEYNLKKIFFNVAIYDKGKEFPALLLNSLDNAGSEYNSYFMPRGWKDYFNLGDLKERLPNWDFTDNDLIGSSPLNLPYVIAGEPFKKIINPLTNKYYQLGDYIEFKIVIHGYQSKQKIKAKIAAFAGSKNVTSKILFFDYGVLQSKKSDFPPLINNPHPSKVISSFTPFNILLTKNKQINYERYLTIDLDFSRDAFDVKNQKFKFGGLLFANVEAPRIDELIILSKTYFSLFEIYFSLILTLMILFALLSLLMGIIFLFQDEHKVINKFRFIGYRLKDLFISQFSIFSILLTLSLIIGFAISISSFVIFEKYFQNFSIFLYVGHIWTYFLWVFLPVFLLLGAYGFYQYRSLRRTLFPE